MPSAPRGPARFPPSRFPPATTSSPITPASRRRTRSPPTSSGSTIPSSARCRRTPRSGPSLIPEPGSPVLDRIPPGSCAAIPFGEYLEGEQHLGQFGIDPVAPVNADQRHVPRPQGGECDIGAVERGPDDGSGGDTGVSAPPLARGPAPGPRGSSEPPPDASGGPGGSKPAPGRLEAKLDRLARFLRPLTQSRKRFRKWRRCISHVPVSELGDPNHRFGFAYDERDGTGRIAARP